jgi:hypothetical protein
VAGLGGAALFAWTMIQAFPAPYTAEMRLTLRRPPSYMPDSGASGVGHEEYLRTQAATIKCGRVVGMALEREAVQSLSFAQDRESVTDNLAVQFLAGDNYLTLRFSAADPGEAAAFLTALVDAYKDDLRRDRQSTAERMQRTLDRANDDLAALTRGLPPFDARQIDTTRMSLTRARAELRKAQSDLDDLQDRKSKVSGVSKRAVALAVEDALRRDDDALRLTREVRDLSAEITLVSRVAAQGEASARVTALKQDRALRESELAEIRRTITSKVEDDLNDRDRSQRDPVLAQARDRVQVLVNEEQVLVQELARLEAAETPQYRKKLAEVKALETVRNTLQTTLIRIGLDGDEVPWVLAGQPAVPQSRDPSAQLKLVGLGTVALLGCLLLGIALKGTLPVSETTKE